MAGSDGTGPVGSVKTTASFALAALALLVVFGTVQAKERKTAGEELVLPYRASTPHILTQAYEAGTHRRYGAADERFAIDLAMPGCKGFGADVIAPLSGRVRIGGDNLRQGKNLLIVRSDGLSCRLAHLEQILVSDGEMVQQGALVGLEGNTGAVSGSECLTHPGTHIHLSCYRGGTGVKPEPISGYRGLEARLGQELEGPDLIARPDERVFHAPPKAPGN